MVNVLALMTNTTEGAAHLCEGVPDSQIKEAIAFQRLAAEHGDVRMRLWYVRDPALDRQYFLDDLEQWAHYREVAPRYLYEALEAGDPQAPAVLAEVYRPDVGLVPASLIPLRQADAARYFVYHELALLLAPPAQSPRPQPPGAVSLDPVPGPEIDMAEVRAQAQDLLRKYYAGHVPTPQGDAPVESIELGNAQEICAQ